MLTQYCRVGKVSALLRPEFEGTLTVNRDGLLVIALASQAENRGSILLGDTTHVVCAFGSGKCPLLAGSCLSSD